jgi:hypothetical protein
MRWPVDSRRVDNEEKQDRHSHIVEQQGIRLHRKNEGDKSPKPVGIPDTTCLVSNEFPPGPLHDVDHEGHPEPQANQSGFHQQGRRGRFVRKRFDPTVVPQYARKARPKDFVPPVTRIGFLMSLRLPIC